MNIALRALALRPGRLIVLVQLGLLACGGDDPANPTTTSAVTVAVSPIALDVPAGQSRTAAVTVTRSGASVGAVDLSLEGAPTGVTGVFTPATVPAGSSSSALTINAAATRATGAFNLSVRGTSAGATPGVAPLSLAVTAGSSTTAGTATVSVSGTQSFSGSGAAGFVNEGVFILTVSGGSVSGNTATGILIVLGGTNRPAVGSVRIVTNEEAATGLLWGTATILVPISEGFVTESGSATITASTPQRIDGQLQFSAVETGTGRRINVIATFQAPCSRTCT